MDACHLLNIGRPWKYDVNYKHGGRRNVYIISKNGKEYTMRPLPKDEKETQNASRVMMVGEKEFLKTLKVKNTPCFAIVVLPHFSSCTHYAKWKIVLCLN